MVNDRRVGLIKTAGTILAKTKIRRHTGQVHYPVKGARSIASVSLPASYVKHQSAIFTLYLLSLNALDSGTIT